MVNKREKKLKKENNSMLKMFNLNNIVECADSGIPNESL